MCKLLLGTVGFQRSAQTEGASTLLGIGSPWRVHLCEFKPGRALPWGPLPLKTGPARRKLGVWPGTPCPPSGGLRALLVLRLALAPSRSLKEGCVRVSEELEPAIQPGADSGPVPLPASQRVRPLRASQAASRSRPCEDQSVPFLVHPLHASLSVWLTAGLGPALRARRPRCPWLQHQGQGQHEALAGHPPASAVRPRWASKGRWTLDHSGPASMGLRTLQVENPW